LGVLERRYARHNERQFVFQFLAHGESVHGIFFFSLFLSLIEGGGQYAHLRTPAASFFGPPIEGEDEAIMAELAALGVGDATTDGVFPALVDLITSFGQRQLGEWAPPH
jgi:hypothetical protein